MDGKQGGEAMHGVEKVSEKRRIRVRGALRRSGQVTRELERKR